MSGTFYLLMERDALKARVAELEKDAARYRFWRDCWERSRFLATVSSAFRALPQPLGEGSGKNFDIISDAAMGASKEAS